MPCNESPYGPHSSGARRLHTGSHPITETTCDDNQCWCHAVASTPPWLAAAGNLISDGKNVYPYESYERRHLFPPTKTKCDHPHCWCNALLYTQAQVDALVAAERERCLTHVQEQAYLAKFPEGDDGGCDGCATGWCQSAVDQACEQRNRTLDAIRNGK